MTRLTHYGMALRSHQKVEIAHLKPWGKIGQWITRFARPAPFIINPEYKAQSVSLDQWLKMNFLYCAAYYVFQSDVEPLLHFFPPRSLFPSTSLAVGYFRIGDGMFFLLNAQRDAPSLHPKKSRGDWSAKRFSGWPASNNRQPSFVLLLACISSGYSQQNSAFIMMTFVAFSCSLICKVLK